MSWGVGSGPEVGAGGGGVAGSEVGKGGASTSGGAFSSCRSRGRPWGGGGAWF